ncbi:Serine/threonine-protein kinase STY8 [Zea mays]|uniref:non-specific serine/threonine protein kinase n=2 Tax=Zea mays TaxID=4577 RepID=A0A8J8YD64_MAIZE|nr:Protein kinase superfamily protein [Zea mays]PWZ10097.1 Serine/threonine-protein kinase STY8 [Zea mays]
MRQPTSAGGDAGFVRADQIDLKSLDEQLERHLGRRAERGVGLPSGTGSRGGESARLGPEELTPLRRCREDWEIDPTKLVIKGVIARGTFGTVHRGVYDGQDVAAYDEALEVRRLQDKAADFSGGSVALFMGPGKLESICTRSEQEIAALRAAFAQEVVVWHKLEHPNVTKFIGAIMGARDLNIQTEHGHLGMPSNICCVVVEYLPGGALKSFLIKNRRRKLAFKVVVQIALDIARGLCYLHSEKIVHRDVKTENMLLDKTRTVKIADFGVARVEASNPSDMTGETGTLGYMAPEVLNGHAYNRKCDVYSFGICLWEVYCCDMPYPDLSFSEVTSAVVRQNLRPEIPRCCPSSLANVMKRCWDANPDKRPEMAEVVSMLEVIDTSKGGGMIPKDQTQGWLSCFRRYRGP